MIKINDFDIGKLKANNETLQDAVNVFIKENNIMEKDVINITYAKPYIASLIYIDWEE